MPKNFFELFKIVTIASDTVPIGKYLLKDKDLDTSGSRVDF